MALHIAMLGIQLVAAVFVNFNLMSTFKASVSYELIYFISTFIVLCLMAFIMAQVVHVKHRVNAISVS